MTFVLKDLKIQVELQLVLLTIESKVTKSIYSRIVLEELD